MPRNGEDGRWSLAGVAAASAGLVLLAWRMDAARRRESEKMLHRRMVELLLNVLSAGDPSTERHSRRVADLSYALAQAAGMWGRDLRTLRVAALLHDMGKIDDRFFHIVHSRRPLTQKQRAEIKNHPHQSAHILEPLEAEHPGLMEIVSSHHECWNGTGYPHGRRGAEIPLGARVISMADAFDAMTQPRRYRDAIPVERALAELREGGGTQFDPALVTLAESPGVRAAWETVVQRDLFAERCALEDGSESNASAHASPARAT